MSNPDLFWDKVQPTGFCWEWTAYRDRKGYGRSHLDGKSMAAHRVAYTLLVGPIPAGLTLDHLCRNKGCVNPDHLEPVTVGENSIRSHELTSSEVCRNGHVYADEGNELFVKMGAKLAHRRCRQCILVRSHEARGLSCAYDAFCDHPSHGSRRKARTRDGVCRYGHSMHDAYARGNGLGLMCKTCRTEAYQRKKVSA